MTILKPLKILVLGLGVLFFSTAQGQLLLFDGDFESGTFQGWTPSGSNGGFASLAAKGTCYSGNDTTAISFNGDLANQYAALLRSNPQGNPNSEATLRSVNFQAGNGILFSALSETSDGNTSATPVNLRVRIFNGDGSILSELPVQTAVVNLSPGCPSEMRDTAFSVHYIDTHPFEGEISIEFSQQTNSPGFGYFTLIDNVVLIDKGNIVVNQSQPIAVAGTSLTSSNILFLDPRSSIDPDGLPAPLQFSWFINGEQTIRAFDLPCINLNGDLQLSPGNHTATLYATDGVNYAADTLRFVVSGESTNNVTNTDNGENTDNTSGTNSNITQTRPIGDAIINEVNQVNSSGVTMSDDPGEECNIDVAIAIGDEEASGSDDETGPTIDINTNSEEVFDVEFTIGSIAVGITSSNVDITSSTDKSIIQIVITITNPDNGDFLDVIANSVSTLEVANTGTSSVTIAPTVDGESVSDSDYEIVLEDLIFDYIVDGTNNLTQRSITYTVTDSASNTASTNSIINIIEL